MDARIESAHDNFPMASSTERPLGFRPGALNLPGLAAVAQTFDSTHWISLFFGGAPILIAAARSWHYSADAAVWRDASRLRESWFSVNSRSAFGWRSRRRSRLLIGLLTMTVRDSYF